MSYSLEFVTLLKLPITLGESELYLGDKLHIIKPGECLYPLNSPIEFCDENDKYLGKIVITKLTLEKEKTVLYGEIVTIFSEEESLMYSRSN